MHTSHRVVVGGLVLVALATPPCALPAQPAPRRALRVDDLYRLRDVRDPQRSPDGKWVAYTVSTADSVKDRNDTDVWMTSWDGTQTIQLTSSPDGESGARWSPDGRYLSFLSSRQGAAGGQIWLLDRRGGEAAKLTDVKGGVSSYAWAPDARRIAMVVEDTEPGPAARDTARARTPKPIVIDRYHFKQDVMGYLGQKRSHVYLFDVATRKAQILTPGGWNEADPEWSPDGSMIAFVSKRGATDTTDVDRQEAADVWVVEARPGATPRRLTTTAHAESGPIAWSPDGRWLAFSEGGDPRYQAYTQHHLAIVPVAGGAVRVLTPTLDRPVSAPRFTPDGAAIVFVVTDDRVQYVARVPAAGGAVERITTGRNVVSSLAAGGDGDFAALVSSDSEPPEVYALERGALRRLSHQNDEWVAQVSHSTVEDIAFRTKDGVEVHGLLAKPAGYAGGRLPTLLRIHGGPNGQDSHAYNFERELFAANGYAVLQVNYRGSNGRGERFQQAIFGDWGNKEVIDLLAGVDHVVAAGVADPDRLGIGGWSYGGILTDYTIASDRRFRAAISGAGSALQLSMYGIDQYITQYETELGPPWRNPDAWIKVSYPFFHADRITTPTLFMGGERDFNVPIVGGEQMYQALRSLGVETQLVIYPGQFHSINTPSYKRDRLARYVAWYDRHLKTSAKAANAAGTSPR